MRIAASNNLACAIAADPVAPMVRRHRLAASGLLHLQPATLGHAADQVLDNLSTDPFQSLNVRTEHGNFINRHGLFCIC
jgi:hypothetical protein